MKRIIAIAIIAALALTLSSCKKKPADDSSEIPAGSVNETTESSTETNDSTEVDESEKLYLMQHASYEYLTAERLKDEADLIFVGEFTGKTNQIIPDDEKDKERPNNIYTDHEMKVLSVLKGNADNTAAIRIFGGKTERAELVSASGDPNFKEGQKYLLYTRKQINPMVENDVECYYLICGKCHCYNIDENGEPDLINEKQADAEAIKNFYDSMVDTAALAKTDR